MDYYDGVSFCHFMLSYERTTKSHVANFFVLVGWCLVGQKKKKYLMRNLTTLYDICFGDLYLPILSFCRCFILLTRNTLIAHSRALWLRVNRWRKKNYEVNKHDKYQNIGGSVWLSLFISRNGNANYWEIQITVHAAVPGLSTTQYLLK